LEVRPIVSEIVVEKQQLKSTPDSAIGTTKRGTLPPGLHVGLSFSASVTSLQAFPNLNSEENLGHRRASDAI
jgi:hypothetical protein